MNKRIKELLKQSTNPPWDGEQGPMNEFNLERFAELIVLECIELVEGYTKQRAYDTYYKAEEQIRAHFGVSE
jgi:hypothetical protein